MMKRFCLALALLCAPTLAYGQQRVTIQNGTTPVSNSNPLPVAATITPSGTQNVNLTQILGAAPSLTNYLWVFPATGATWAASQSGTWTVQPGNTPNTSPWLFTNIPSAASAAALTKSATQSAASNAVVKSGAGNLYGLTVTVGATAGWVMVFDATALPGNGATGASMVWCYPVNSDGTKGGIDKDFNPPIPFTTGLTVGFSSTACNSLTASATAFFYGRVM